MLEEFKSDECKVKLHEIQQCIY